MSLDDAGECDKIPLMSLALEARYNAPEPLML
jgi:hypothetical protein